VSWGSCDASARERKEGESRADNGRRWRRQSASPRRRRRFVDGESTREEGCSERCKRRSRDSGSAYIGERRERERRPGQRAMAIDGHAAGPVLKAFNGARDEGGETDES
jgi:hypothetical protein